MDSTPIHRGSDASRAQRREDRFADLTFRESDYDDAHLPGTGRSAFSHWVQVGILQFVELNVRFRRVDAESCRAAYGQVQPFRFAPQSTLQLAWSSGKVGASRLGLSVMARTSRVAFVQRPACLTGPVCAGNLQKPSALVQTASPISRPSSPPRAKPMA